MSVFLYDVCFSRPLSTGSWSILIKKRIAKIAKMRTYLLKGFVDFQEMNQIWVMSWQTVHCGRVGRGGSVAVGVRVSDL